MMPNLIPDRAEWARARQIMATTGRPSSYREWPTPIIPGGRRVAEDDDPSVSCLRC